MWSRTKAVLQLFVLCRVCEEGMSDVVKDQSSSVVVCTVQSV